MRYLMEEDEEKYKSHFSRFIKEGVNAENVSWAKWQLPLLTFALLNFVC